MITKLKHEKPAQMDPKIRSDTQQKTEYLTLCDITALMGRDSYRRVKGRVRQKNWAEYR